LEASGIAVVRHDIGALLGGNMPPPPPGRGGVLLLHANPPEAAPLLRAWPTRTWAHRYRVGYWVWELPVPPPSWRTPVAWLDEIWTPSAFSAEALRKLPGAASKVCVMAHPVQAGAPVAPRLAAFGIAEDEVAILTAFDFRSTRARKNPEGALAAYIAAFPAPQAGVRLVIKALAPEADPGGAAALQALVGGRRDVTLITQELSNADMAALIASIDIVLSLHRAEGFGLLPAQAMAQGKAVLVTGWSGVMEYADAASAALAPYRLGPAIDPSGLYQLAGAQWAEPDIDAAAQALRRLVEDGEARRALGAQARRKIAQGISRAFEASRLPPSLKHWLA
jgi:glycosyltransferase involved in cell wall biosynthesis